MAKLKYLIEQSKNYPYWWRNFYILKTRTIRIPRLKYIKVNGSKIQLYKILYTPSLRAYPRNWKNPVYKFHFWINREKFIYETSTYIGGDKPLLKVPFYKKILLKLWS